MSISTNIVAAIFGNSRRACGDRILFQRDRGQVLTFPDLADQLPPTFQVWFANHPEIGTAVPQTGADGSVAIPDTLIATGSPIWAWLYLHTGADDGETCYMVTILNTAQPAFTGATPTPAQASAWDEAIAELNEAIEAAEAAASHGPQIVNGFWYTWNAETEEYENTNVKADGEDGYSPVVTISSITGGHRVTITDEDHPSGQSFDVMDGESATIDDTLSIPGDAADAAATGAGINAARHTADYALLFTETLNSGAGIPLDAEWLAGDIGGSRLYRAHSKRAVLSKTQCVLQAAAGYRFYVRTYSGGSYTDSNWYGPDYSSRQTYTLPAGADVIVAVGAYPENTSVTADPDVLGAAITIKNNIGSGGGGGGTSDYSNLTNKPQINGVTLSGNKSLADIGITPDVYYATYGTTTSAEVEAAYQAGKIVLVEYGSSVFQLAARTSATYHAFTVATSTGTGTVVLNNDVWSTSSKNIPSASNSTPQPLGTASAGSAIDFSRADHVHQKPTASDIGAIAAPEGGSVGQVLKKTASGTEWANESGGGGGFTIAAKAKLIDILQHAVYDSDQTADILELQGLLNDSGTVSVTYSLTDVISSNTDISANVGESYTTTLTPNDPTYSLTNVQVTVGGTDVTSSVYNSATGVITIGAVSGDIVITASAAYIAILYNWNLKSSLTDTIQNLTAVTNATRDANGVTFTSSAQYIGFTNSISMKDKTIEIDVSSASTYNGSTTYHGRLIAFSTSSTYRTDTTASTFCWNKNQSKWGFYLGSAWGNYASVAANYFKGKTIRCYVSSTGIVTISASSDGTIFETIGTSSGTFSYTTGLVIGSSGTDSLTGMVITGVRIYEGDLSA